VATLLTHINNTLRLIGEQPLLSSSGNLGDLTKQALDEALLTVVQETRHSSFVSLTSFVASNANYLQPAFALPGRCVQLLTLYYQVPDTSPQRLVKLVPGALETLATNHRFLVVGSQVYVGNVLERPCSLTLKALVAPALPTLDTDNLAVESEVALVVEAVAAALLAYSYLDDGAQANTLERRAQEAVVRLRTRAGLTRDGVRFR
jgi:hypothetical protein